MDQQIPELPLETPELPFDVDNLPLLDLSYPPSSNNAATGAYGSSTVPEQQSSTENGREVIADWKGWDEFKRSADPAAAAGSWQGLG